MTEGGPVRSFAKLIADKDAEINDRYDGVLEQAEDAVIAASLAQSNAEAAAFAAAYGANFKASEAVGLAETPSGQGFSILSPDGLYLIVYKNNAGAALEITRYFTKAFFDRLFASGFTAERIGALFSWLDSAGHLLAEIKLDGNLWSKGRNVTAGVDTAIAAYAAGLAAATAAATVLPGPTRSDSLLVFTDSVNRRYARFLENGEFEVKGLNHSQTLAAVPAAIAAIFPSATIDGFGDSLEQGSGSTGGLTLAVQLSALYAAAGAPRTVSLSGLGGQGCTSILARQGSVPALVTFPTGASGFPEIQASGSVNVTVTGNPLVYPGDAASATSMACTIAGIPGTLNRASGNSGGQYSFARTTAGAAIPVDASVPANPTFGTLGYGMSLCWIGTNDLLGGASAATIMGYIDAYVSYQKTAQKRCIVIMPLFDNTHASVAAYKATYATLLALVKAKYPFNSIDTLALLQRSRDGSANDLADVAAGLVPRSLTAVDRLHLINAGYGVVAAAIKSINDSKGW